MTKEYAVECLEEMLYDYQVYNHNYYGVAEIPVDPDDAEALKMAIKLLKNKRKSGKDEK